VPRVRLAVTGPKALLRASFRSLLSVYFRSIEVVGDRPVASTSGRVFVSNHSNALIDPILVLTHAPCDLSPLGKSTLWDIPGLKWLLDLADAVPVKRRKDDPNKSQAANDEMFAKIAEHLGRGGNILVFPEGTSHNEPHMIRLKTGAARMLERARAEGARSLTFQSVGLEFDSRHSFRSRAVVAYGPVRELDAFEPGALDAITEQMRSDLAALVTEGKSWDERRLILRVAELVNQARGSTSFADAARIAQRVEAARDRLTREAPELYEDIERAVSEYFSTLERLGGTQKGRHAPPLFMWAALPLFPVGVALYFVPYQLPRLVASRTDEIDQHSTLKLATGLVAYPVWAATLFAAGRALFGRRVSRTLLLAILLGSPAVALYWLEHKDDLRRALRGAEAGSTELEAKRAAALAAIERARALLEPTAG
jgi:glycerol-3-phosphate O-acyltransferase / dihydroxyacetone phosphate acyltransferase